MISKQCALILIPTLPRHGSWNLAGGPAVSECFWSYISYMCFIASVSFTQVVAHLLIKRPTSFRRKFGAIFYLSLKVRGTFEVCTSKTTALKPNLWRRGFQSRCVLFWDLPALGKQRRVYMCFATKRVVMVMVEPQICGFRGNSVELFICVFPSGFKIAFSPKVFSVKDTKWPKSLLTKHRPGVLSRFA